MQLIGHNLRRNVSQNKTPKNSMAMMMQMGHSTCKVLGFDQEKNDHQVIFFTSSDDHTEQNIKTP